MLQAFDIDSPDLVIALNKAYYILALFLSSLIKSTYLTGQVLLTLSNIFY